MKYTLTTPIRTVINTISDLCEQYDLPKPRIEMGGKHVKCFVDIDGRQYMLPIALSPRCGPEQASKVKTADFRRLIRQVRGAA